MSAGDTFFESIIILKNDTFLLKISQNELSLTQNGVKKYKKVSKSEILNQNTLKNSKMSQNMKL